MQRDHPVAAADQRHHLRDLLPAPDERRRRPREVRVRDGLQRRERVRAKLVDPDGFIEVLQPVLAQVLHFHAEADKLPRCPRQKDLPAMAARGDPGAQVHVRAHIPLRAHQRHARVHPHPHPDRAGRQRPPPLLRGLHRAPSRRERHKERVPLRVDLDPAVPPERVAQQPPMLPERLLVARWADLMEQPGRPLDVSEQERHRPTRQIPPYHVVNARVATEDLSRVPRLPPGHPIPSRTHAGVPQRGRSDTADRRWPVVRAVHPVWARACLAMPAGGWRGEEEESVEPGTPRVTLGVVSHHPKANSPTTRLCYFG